MKKNHKYSLDSLLGVLAPLREKFFMLFWIGRILTVVYRHSPGKPKRKRFTRQDAKTPRFFLIRIHGLVAPIRHRNPTEIEQEIKSIFFSSLRLGALARKLFRSGPPTASAVHCASRTHGERV